MAKAESLLHVDSNHTATAIGNAAILLIGDVAGPAFAPIQQQLVSANARHAATLSAALDLIDAESWSPDFVVIWQGFPDEYSRSQAEQLIGQLPLARWVVVFGPWCESIGRTEQLWPVAWSVPLRHADTRIQSELRQLQHGAAPFPATMSRDETFAALHTIPPAAEQAGHSLTARISSDDRAFCDFLSDGLVAMGIDVTGGHDASLQILHVSVPDTGTCDTIHACRIQSPDSRIVVISELMTPQTEQSCLAAGADVSVTQLRCLTELAEWL
jgi:DNA-binding NarL/FixJ family response regulator